MPQIQVDALATFVHQLPELVNQLKIANKLKAWELKHKYWWVSLQDHYDSSDDESNDESDDSSNEIDKILNENNN